MIRVTLNDETDLPFPDADRVEVDNGYLSLYKSNPRGLDTQVGGVSPYWKYFVIEADADTSDTRPSRPRGGPDE